MSHEQNITLALIGKGRWGSNYLKEVEKVKGCQIKYIKTRDYKDLLNYNDLDGIIIATPAETHAEIINDFPNSYLLVEKPLTTNLNTAKKIINKKIMVGHTYLFNEALMEGIRKVGKIKKFIFVLQNTDSYGSKVGPIWELAPHAASIIIRFIKGATKITSAEMTHGNLKAKLKIGETDCLIDVGWNYPEKKREFIFVGENAEIRFDGTEQNQTSPLESELRSFVNLIKGGKNESPLDEGIKVVKLLSQIEKKCTT